jgi:D-alanyl-D-alanine carboxypeptidase/D-alanyl-D-alanine-endopeptidase (penicillin-binding protein 4)
MRRLTAILALIWALAGLLAPAAGAESTSALRRVLLGGMGAAGSGSGAYVVDLSESKVLFNSRADTRRILASNTKIFTTTAALERFGSAGTLETRVLGEGTLDPVTGRWDGDLYLKGGGDPTFGTASFIARAYGRTGADIEQLVVALQSAGITSVRGRVYGDETAWDALRGGPDSGYGISGYVGPLSALSFNRGLATETGHGFQGNPPLFAARKLDAALEDVGVTVRGAPRTGPAPLDATQLAAVESPPMSRLVRLTNKPSDNFFAEQLMKALAALDNGIGTTAGGTRVVMAAAKKLGGSSRLVDGSGLARGNRASPKAIVRILTAARSQEWFDAFYDSLPVAGRDGTLYDRMRRGPAHNRCRAKTGTIAGVSALSGYCTAISGDVIAFSFLMNGVSVTGARRLQNRMAAAIARYG